jgi:uncharacterized protein YjiS (DUF1127 family)
METIMSSPFLSTIAHGDSFGSRLWQGVSGAAKRWVVAEATRRMEAAAIAQLRTMSDRELRDIGIHRAEIEFAVIHGTRDTRHGVLSSTNG